jgi:hypothetical protein
MMASLSLSTTKASLKQNFLQGQRTCSSLHFVSCVDIIFTTGMQGPLDLPAFISASIVFAMAMASEFTSIIEV